MGNNKDNVRAASGLSMLSGLWLIVSSNVLGYSVLASRINDLWIGIILITLAIIRLVVPNKTTAWLSVMTVLIGLWLVVAPFALGYSMITQVWNNVIMGVLTVIFGSWGITGTELFTQEEKNKLQLGEFDNKHKGHGVVN